MYSDLRSKIDKIYIRFTEELPDPTSVCLFMKEIDPIIEEYELRMKGSVSWSIEDLQHTAFNLKKPYTLSDQLAQEILEKMIDKHDASIGITWDTLEYYVQEYRPEEIEDEDD